MPRKFFSVFVILFSCSCLTSSAQKIDSMLNVYAENFSQEKVYMQFDKKAYSAGDRIWYKAYLYAGFDPSQISKNFYTEIYDADGNLLLRNASPVRESTTTGSFDIPVNFTGTRIRIRAYTVWMLNFDTSFVYTKDLRIMGPSQDSAVHPEPTPTTLHFFPEGGDLIAGADNNIAFKATDAYGQPRKVSGDITNQAGKVIFSFSTGHNGMGKFILSPDKGEVLTAVWKDEKGIEQKTDFPSVKSSGIALRVVNSGQKLVFSIARPADSIPDPRYVIMAVMNQHMVYKANVNLQDVYMTGGAIPTNTFPTGTLTITVFDMHQKPLAERICFVNNHEYSFPVNLNMATTSLKKRGRSELEVQLPPNIKSDVSIAITDAEVDGNRMWDDNIISNLLLTGDLKGSIKNPFYYFQNSSDSLVQQLDLVMLTNGWRRFNWDDLAKGKTPVIKFPADNYLSINAEVLGVDASKIAKDESINVFLQSKDSGTKMLSIPYVRNGKFHEEGLIYFDTVKVYYSFNTNHNLSNEAAVILKNGLLQPTRKLRAFKNMTLASWSPDDSSLLRKNRQVAEEVARQQDQNLKVQNLQAVTVKVRVKSEKQKLDEQYSSGLFSGGSATIFDLLHDPFAVSYQNALQYLQSRVAGLQINVGPPPTLSWRGGTPTIYLDEMKVEPDMVSTLPTSNIAMIKVFTPGTSGIFGSDGSGVIAVYTKRGGDQLPDPTVKGLDMARLQGYSKRREFYSPDYLINPEPETDDIRTTLYWNPHLRKKSGSNTISVPFYNSDITHRIRIILEGVDDEGKLTHVEKILE